MNRDVFTGRVVDFNNSKSIRLFSMHLHRFLFSNEIMSLLPGYGWNDGGCYTLAKALSIWSNGVFTIRAVVADKETSERQTIQHLVVEVPHTGYYIDGNGILDVSRLLNWKMEKLEGIPNCIIVPVNSKRVIKEGVFELLPDVAIKLAKLILVEIGVFTDVFPGIVKGKHIAKDETNA